MFRVLGKEEWSSVKKKERRRVPRPFFFQTLLFLYFTYLVIIIIVYIYKSSKSPNPVIYESKEFGLEGAVAVQALRGVQQEVEVDGGVLGLLFRCVVVLIGVGWNRKGRGVRARGWIPNPSRP